MLSLKPERIIKKLIGGGRFGEVYPYQKNPDDDKWVVKIQHSFSKDLPKKIQEIVLGFSCDHPHVLPIKGFHIDYKENSNSWDFYLKMPRMVGTLSSKLNENIKEKKYFSDQELIRYFYEITSGVAYLHNRKIAHRDIKLDNILLDKNGSVVVSDVGLGKLVDDQTSDMTQEKFGALNYLAPEVLLETEIPLKGLYKADAWSLGVAITELCLLKTNFLKFHLSGEQKEAQLAQQLESIRGQYQDNSFIDLVLMLLKHNPDERASVEVVKQKLAEKYGKIIRNIRGNDKFSREEIFSEEKKSPELMSNEGHHGNKEEQANMQIWRDQIEAINKELEKTKKEFLEFKEERLQSLIQEIGEAIISNFEGERLFTYDLFTYQNLAGIKIQPKDPSKRTDGDIKKSIQSFTAKLNQHNWRQLDLLYVNFKNCKQITDDALAELAIEIGTQLTNLKCCDKLTNKGVGHLATQIGNKLIALESLKVYFSNSPNITDDGAQQLVSQIGNNLKNLQELALNFSRCNVSDTTINEIIKYLPNQLQNLIKLYLYFHYTNIPVNTLIQLVDQIVTNLKSVKAFELGLIECNISDEILHELVKHLENSFSNLEDLGLHFDHCKNITNKAVLELVEKISLKKIHTLRLSLSSCVQISDQTVRSIGNMVESNLKTSQNLTLWLNGLPLTDETKKLLRDSLKNIPNLKLYF